MADYGQFENSFFGGAFQIIGSSDSTADTEKTFFGGTFQTVEQAVLQDVTAVVGGGAIAGGASDLVAVRIAAGIGGAIGGGTSVITQIIEVDSIGGAVGGGASTLTAMVVISAIGGSVGGGGAVYYACKEYESEGGAIGGGEVTPTFGFFYTAIGGAIAGGEGELGARIETKQVDGGGIAGGLASFSRTLGKVSVGGAVAGGAIAPYLVTRAYTSEGGAIGGGTLGTFVLRTTEVGRPFWGINVSSDPVWAFSEQANKWGYLNNPRWMNPSGAPVSYDLNPEDEPQVWEPRQLGQSEGSSIKHIPCGHWHKTVPVPPVENISMNIYGLFYMGGLHGKEIWGVYFDGNSLTYKGRYQAGDDVTLNGVLAIGDNIITVAGVDGDAEIRLLDGDDFSLLSTHTPFNEYDVTLTSTRVMDNALTQYNNSGDIYFSCSNGYAIRLSDAYARLARGNTGTVVTGTDGHLYEWSYVYSGWFGGWPEFRPISGAGWDTTWNLIPDDLIDGPTEVWSESLEAWAGEGTSGQIIVNGSYLYVLSIHSPYSKIYKLNRTTYVPIARTEDFGIIWYIYYFNNKVYAGAGTLSDFTIYKLNADTLVEEDRLHVEDMGRLPKITDAGGYIIVGTDSYVTSTACVYKLNADTLEIEGRIIISDIDPLISCQAILKLNEQFVCVGYNGGMLVIDITNMTLVDRLGTPGYVTGFAHRCLTHKDNSIYV